MNSAHYGNFMYGYTTTFVKMCSIEQSTVLNVILHFKFDE